MSLRLALTDAANCCAREGASATLTLKGSGVQVTGKLDGPAVHADTAHIHKPDGGWATLALNEIAAVETTPYRTSFR